MPSLGQSILASAIVIFAVVAFGLIVLQIMNTMRMKKQKDYFRDLHMALKPGVEVMLSSGLYGKVTKVTDEIVMVELAKGITVKASRYSVQEIVKE